MMENVPKQPPNKVALKCGLAALVSGLLFCGLAILIGGVMFFGFVGSLVFAWCIALAFYGFGMLIAQARSSPSGGGSKWVTWLALAILILNFPIGVLSTFYTFSQISIYTITIINDSPRPLEAVTLRSAIERKPIPIGTIQPGQHAKMKWDARDEEGVILRASWNGRLIDQDVTGYTIWEDPENVTVRLDSSGQLTTSARGVVISQPVLPVRKYN